MMPKDYIGDIKNRYLNSDKEFVLPSLNRSIDRIEKAFPRYGGFLMEFIQNADDVSSSSIIIEIVENEVRVFNNGRPFSKPDVDSICKVGLSSKTPEDYIGYLGVGFKSVFLISDSPEIYSGDYKFKFSKNYFSEPERTPWQVIPLWIEDSSIVLSSGYTTAFNIPLKEAGYLEKLQEETKPEYISNRMLLFLRNLKNIEIKNTLQGTKRIIKKSQYFQTADYEIYLIQEHFNEELKTQEYWLVFRSTCEVPLHVKEDLTTKEWERDGVDKREVVVAFRLDKKENIIIEEKGTAHIGVFSFLPLKEVPSGLNFLIQADFLTTPGRAELARECTWNDWLAKEIHKLIIEKCIPVFIRNGRWRTNFVEVLYSPWGGHELFENNIKRPLREYLETQPCLIAADGSVVKSDEAVQISSHSGIIELLTESELKALYPNKKVLHPDCSFPWEIGRRVEIEPRFNLDSGLSDKMRELLNIKSKEENINFFMNFYRKYLLIYRYSSPSTLFNLKFYNIILTENLDLTNVYSVYIKFREFTIPQEIRGNFKIVHPDIASDSEISEMLKILGVKELTSEHIQNILKTKEIPTINRNWVTFSDNEKIEKITVCKELWKEDQIDIRDLSFLTLKAKSGKWLKPDQIVFPKEYQPDHRIEILIEKELLDLPIEFLSAEFMQGKTEDEIRDWHEFFEELGVDKVLEDRNVRKNIVSRIGILTALKFEESKGRDARELSRSEEIGGYDILQSPQESDEGFGLIVSQERYIEVKSSGRLNPDIFLTIKQFSTLQEKREKYFVYVVKDVLRYPTLCVTRGDRLLAITEIKTIIPFNKWWRDAKDEEFQP